MRLHALSQACKETVARSNEHILSEAQRRRQSFLLETSGENDNDRAIACDPGPRRPGVLALLSGPAGEHAPAVKGESPAGPMASISADAGGPGDGCRLPGTENLARLACCCSPPSAYSHHVRVMGVSNLAHGMMVMLGAYKLRGEE